MNKFKDFIEIDKKFQNSINLQLDIDNLSKLNSYIPTHSSILVLDGFLNNVLSAVSFETFSILLIVFLVLSPFPSLSKASKTSKRCYFPFP